MPYFCSSAAAWYSWNLIPRRGPYCHSGLPMERERWWRPLETLRSIFIS